MHIAVAMYILTGLVIMCVRSYTLIKWINAPRISAIVVNSESKSVHNRLQYRINYNKEIYNLWGSWFELYKKKASDYIGNHVVIRLDIKKMKVVSVHKSDIFELCLGIFLVIFGIVALGVYA